MDSRRKACRSTARTHSRGSCIGRAASPYAFLPCLRRVGVRAAKPARLLMRGAAPPDVFRPGRGRAAVPSGLAPRLPGAAGPAPWRLPPALCPPAVAAPQDPSTASGIRAAPPPILVATQSPDCAAFTYAPPLPLPSFQRVSSNPAVGYRSTI